MQNKTALNELLHRVDSMHDDVALDEVRIADSRGGRFYRYNERACLALKVALITGRPLLLVGPPGCGKSSLAPYVARNLGMQLFTYTVTETAEASDLLWRMDYLRRLNDAQINLMRPLADYVDKGILWRAFENDGSADAGDRKNGSLVLIDEIDKANASFANSLLVAIGSMQFDVPLLQNVTVTATEDSLILVVMTSNEERELPPAFLRRCIMLRVDYPTADELIEITQRRWPMWTADTEFSASVQSLAEVLTREDVRKSKVSTAEFLDLVQVLRTSGISSNCEAWRTVEELILLRTEEGGA